MANTFKTIEFLTIKNSARSDRFAYRENLNLLETIVFSKLSDFDLFIRYCEFSVRTNMPLSHLSRSFGTNTFSDEMTNSRDAAEINNIQVLTALDYMRKITSLQRNY